MSEILKPLEYVQRSGEEEFVDTIYRALTTPLMTNTFHTPTEYIHIDWNEFLSIASNEWTPLVDGLTRVAEAADITHNWLEQRYSKTPTISFLAEGDDPVDSNGIAPTRYSNTMATQGVSISMTDEAQIVARAGGLIGVGPDAFGYQMAEKSRQMKRNMEISLLESTEISNADPRAYRGILGNYRNANATTAARNGWIGDSGVGVESATSKDLAGIEVNAANIESILDAHILQFQLLQGGGLPTDYYVPPRRMKVLKDAASTKIQITMTQDEVGKRVAQNLGGMVGKFLTAFGIVNIIAHPLLEVASSSGDARLGYSRFLALDPTGFQIVDYRNFGGVHMEVRPKTSMKEKRLLFQMYTLRARKLLSHGAIRNFWIA